MHAQVRLHYLDNLRVFCMLFGILVQSNRLAEQGVWLIFPEISAFFRMATFFAISGFFAAMLYDRWSPGQFFQHRLVAILVPLAFGLLILNPVTISMMTSFHDPAAPALSFFEALSGLWTERAGYSGPVSQVLQLWFLIALAVYVVLVPVFVPLAKSFGSIAGRVLGRMPQTLWPFALSLAVLLAVIVARTFYEVLGRVFDDSIVLREVLMFAPYFMIGVSGFVFRELWERIHVIDIRTVALGLALLIFHKLVFGDRLGPLSTLVEIAGYTVMTMAALYALLWVFRRLLDFSSPTTRFLSDGIYTVYILQIFLIYGFGHLMGLMGVPVEAMYWPAVILTFVTGYAIYHGLVAHSSVLTLLLKGRMLGRFSRTSAAE